MTPRMAIALAALGNALVALYLHLWKLGLAGTLSCGSGGGCAVAQGSSYGWFLGVDVALIGAVGWSVIFVIAFVGTLPRWEDAGWPTALLTTLVVAALLFTARLKYGEFIVLRTFCAWCAINAVIVLLSAGLLWLDWRRLRRSHARVPGQATAALGALLLIAAAPRATVAQGGAPARPDTSARKAASRADSLPPIVTTVLRTRLDPVRAPFAVAVTTSEAVRGARPGLGLDETLRNVPGVQVDNRFNAALGERISIRGFGARTQFGVRGVRVLVDGVPATMPDGQTTLNHVELGALERAEVVRGPASALYGNAAGGVVQLESEPAPDAPFGVRVRALGGSDALGRAQATAGGRGRVGAGAGDWALTGSRVRYGGFREWSTQEATRVLARAGWQGGADAVRASVAYVDYDARNPGALADSARTAAPERAFANNVRQRTGEAGRHGQLGLQWRREAGAHALEASAFALARTLDNPIPVRIVVLDRRAGGVRGAYTLSTPGALPRDGGAPEAPALRLTVGGELQQQRDDRQNFANALGARGPRQLDQLERVGTAAAFAQGTAALGARTTLLAGLRADRVRFAAEDRLVSATNPDDSGERTMHAVSPSVGVSVEVAPGVAFYANAATAFETPTTTELANRPTEAGGFNPALSPQRARSVEAGMNGARPIGTRLALSWQLAAYHTRLTDALVPFEVPDAPGRQFFRNAGQATHRGVEAGTALLVGSVATVRAAYTLTDARFDRYAVGAASFAGRRVPGVAPERLDLAVLVRGPRGAFVELEQRTQSWTPADDANRARSPGWSVATVRGVAPELRLAGVRVAPFAGVANLFGRRWDAAVTVNAAGQRYYEPGPGRTVYLGTDLVGLAGGRR